MGAVRAVLSLPRRDFPHKPSQLDQCDWRDYLNDETAGLESFIRLYALPPDT